MYAYFVKYVLGNVLIGNTRATLKCSLVKGR